MYWVVQNNIYSEEGHEKLVSALERLDLPHSLHKCVPFVGLLEPPAEPPEGSKVIVMGSYTMALEAQRRSWTPGSFINENLDYRVQLQHWGNKMINHGARFLKLGDCFNLSSLEVHQLLGQPFFIRPVVDSKSFTGSVMDLEQLQEWLGNLAKLTPEDGSTVDLNTEVMVAPLRKIYAEYRTWVVDKKVVTASQYKFGTIKRQTADVPDQVIAYAERCAQEWSPHRAYVLDIFQADSQEEDVDDSAFFIGEVNNLNSAGFYAADMNKLVIALENAFDAPVGR